MICIKAHIPAELCLIDDELKAIYHSKDSFCVWVFKTTTERDNFVAQTAGMNKDERSQFYIENYV